MTLTPNDIDVLLHYHCCGFRPHDRLYAPAVEDSVNMLLAEGMLQPHPEGGPGCYQSTARGHAHISQLCALALPNPAWADEHGRIIRDYMETP